MKVKFTLTPEAAAIITKMYEDGELADVGVTECREIPDEKKELEEKPDDREYFLPLGDSDPQINPWSEMKIHDYNDQQLVAQERIHNRGGNEEPLLANLFLKHTICGRINCEEKTSVISGLFFGSSGSWGINDSKTFLSVLGENENPTITVIPGGVAILQPNRPLHSAIDKSVLVLGHTPSGIPLGLPQGELTNLFFLICCCDYHTELGAMARLMRLIIRPGFIDELRDCISNTDLYETIIKAERNLLK
jgi:nitrogen PTS system EIIA component